MIHKRANKPREVKSSWLIWSAWVLMFLWAGFMIFYWKTGHLTPDKATVEYVENAIVKAENVLKEEFQHIRVSVPINHPPSTSSETIGSHVDSNPVAPYVPGEYDVHVIFSTDCSPYQDWQSLLLFHSATVVGQKGPITRIASGCDDDKAKILKLLYKKLYPQYHIHFTPDFKKDEKSQKSYDFYNKPRGLQHWLKFADPPLPADTIVALLDPDMIFVRPITSKMRGQPNNVYGRYMTEEDIMEKIVPGKPAAQLYGLGAPWTNDNHKKFNRGYICGEGSPCLIPDMLFGERHYAVGPPYIGHMSDMQRIADTWTEFVPRVYEGYPYLLAEMYAYSMAAAHEKLPHVQFENFMVSNTDSPGEGWPLVDVLADTCVPPVNGIYYPGTPLPNVVHYCQNFRASMIGFAKRSANKQMFSCDAPLFVEPPSDLAFSDFRIHKRKKESMGKLQVKRNSYALCVIHRSLNAALIDYKQRMCDPSKEFVNYNKTYIVLQNG